MCYFVMGAGRGETLLVSSPTSHTRWRGGGNVAETQL